MEKKNMRLFGLIFLVMFGLMGFGCDDESSQPDPCDPNPCGESHSLCANEDGEAVCRCPIGYSDSDGECCPLNSTFIGELCQCNTGFVDNGENGCKSNCAATENPADSVDEPVLRMTLPASWDENWYASVVVYDLDGDGKMEIIAARHSVLYVWNSEGSVLWRAPVGEDSDSVNDHGEKRQYASPVVGDLDGDGNGEIAIAWDNKVAIYDHNGFILNGWPQSFPGSQGEIRSIAAGDLNLDGIFEILAVKTSGGPVTVAWDIGGKVVSGWPQANCEECYDYGGYNQNIGVADLDGDGFPEVVSTYDRSRLGIMYGDGTPYPANEMFSGPWASSIPSFHDINLAIQGWGEDMMDRDEFTDSPPVFADIDGDGQLELVIYSDHERAGEYIIQGNCLWVLNPDMTRVAGFETPICSGEPLFTTYENNIVQVAPSPAVGNLSGDSRPEIIVPSYDGQMRCYSPDGDLLWSYIFDDDGSPFIGASGAAIGDLNGDGNPEVVFNIYSVEEGVSQMVILSAGGEVIHEVSLAGRGDMSVPTLADIDGDGKLEIIISLKDSIGDGDGGVQIWDVDSARTNCLYWPTGRGNYLRNGCSF
jgi:FG-GAP-like repeat